MILTDQHQHPPRLINTGTGTVASAALIKQNDVQRMSIYRLYRHECIGPGPYGDWELTNDAEGPLFTRQTRELTADEQAAQLQAWRESATVDRVYAELTLIEAGLFDAVTAYFESPDRTDAERVWFRSTPRWRRMHDAVQTSAAAFGLSDEQLDGLFQAALAKQEADR
jgi:hypothetical protein